MIHLRLVVGSGILVHGVQGVIPSDGGSSTLGFPLVFQMSGILLEQHSNH